jgi:hypothetical protein
MARDIGQKVKTRSCTVTDEWKRRCSMPITLTGGTLDYMHIHEELEVEVGKPRDRNF